MPKIIKFILKPLLLASILGLFSFYGCSGAGMATPTSTWVGVSAENLNQQQLQQMLADSVDSFNNLNTYQFDMSIDVVSSTAGGSNPWNTTLKTQMVGGTNIASKETQMTLKMSINMLTTGQNSSEDSLTYDMYALTDWIYMKMSLTGLGDQWIKVPLSSELEDTLNLNSVGRQMGPLDSPTKVDYLRTEKVDGVDCNVLSVSPSASELAKWLSKEATGSGSVDWQSLVNDPNAFKNFSILYYVAKDTNLMMRMVIEMNIELSGQQAGSISAFDKMQMNLKMDMKTFAHNQPYSVTLPVEAASAQEVPESVFSN
ncbi:MAG: hypothetical protein ACYDG5_00865 [Dehalococcoidales bacterium]